VITVPESPVRGDDRSPVGEVAQTLIELQKEHLIELDDGVDDAFMKDLGEKLQPGNAAVFVLVRKSTPDKVLPRISQYGGDVIHNSLTEEAEETLREALREHATRSERGQTSGCCSAAAAGIAAATRVP
jgi:uncharacterized membrane protein